MSIHDLFKKFKANVQSGALSSRSNSITEVLHKENFEQDPMIIDTNSKSNSKISNPTKRKFESKESFSSEENENTIPFQSLPIEWRPPLKKTKKSNPPESKSKPKVIKISEPKPNKKVAGPLAMKSLSKESIEEIVENIDEAKENNSINNSFKMPSWLKPENILDKNFRRPGEEDYDPTTLHIPHEDWINLTSFMRQYWEIKSVHFDKIVAHSMFDMYWFYYEDAIITAKLLDLKLGTHEDKIQSYIHTKSLDKNVSKLLNAGYRVVIVEKIDGVYQDPIKSKKKKEDVLNREVSQILTKGTYVGFDESYEPRFTLCVVERELKIGIILMETTVHEFYAEEFIDDELRSKLKNLLRKFKPREIVFYNELLSDDILKFAKSLSSNPLLSSYSLSNDITTHSVIHKMKSTIGETPKIFENLHRKVLEKEITHEDEGHRMIFTLSLCFQFLEDILLSNIILPKAKWFEYSKNLDSKATLYMDYHALDALEILEVPYLQSNDRLSLLGIIDKTASPFGKRLLKRWITAPLTDSYEIIARNQVVDDLMMNPKAVEILQGGLGKMGDLERKIHRVYNMIDKRKMRALRAEDVVLKRMMEFDELLKEMKTIEITIKFFQEYHHRFKSQRLRLLTLFKKDSELIQESYTLSVQCDVLGLFPRLNYYLDEIKGSYQILESKFYPAPGAHKEADFLLSQLEKLKIELNSILESARIEFKCKEITFCHSKQPYELEVPETAITAVLREKYILGSKRKGYLRFYTPEIENLVKRQKMVEESLQKIMADYILEVFSRFYEYSHIWDQAILCLGELDCLCSLSRYARELEVKCKPQVLPMSNDLVFDLKGMKHPLLMKLDNKTVANDVVAECPVFMITGPNMGGKSTLLRMTCLAIILAQIGSYVPASSFKFTAFDRIFTRIGASDKIMEGKSTFFIELEEVYHMVTEATKNSILIIDELGRGTSTFDGIALAYSTLKFISQKIQCLTMFATHYHSLLKNFENDPAIIPFFMDYDYNKEEELVFKFKLKKGKDTRSHGLKIAEMAKIEKDVIEAAKIKSKAFSLISKSTNLNDKLGQFLKITEFVKEDNLSEESEKLFQALTGLIIHL